MKKLFTLFVALFAAFSVSAEEYEIDIDTYNADGLLEEQEDGSYLVDFSSYAAWGGWINLVRTDDDPGFDASDYSYLVVEFAQPLTFTLNIILQNSSWGAITSATGAAGASLISLSLSGLDVTETKQVCAQNVQAGDSVYISRIYFSTEKVVEDPLSIAASSFGTANEDGTYTVSCSGGTEGKTWYWNGSWLGGVDWSDYTYLVVELADTVTAGNAKSTVQYLSDCSVSTEGYSEEGSYFIVNELSADYKDQVYQVALQGETDFTIKAVYLTNSLSTTGIKSVSVVKEAVEDADAPIYNLQGQRVTKDTKGILIQNGKKFVNK